MAAAMYHNMPMADYAAIKAWNYSSIKHGRRSMAHAFEAMNGERSEQSDAMLVGEALHCWLLERPTFDVRFLIADVPDRRTKQGKAEYEALVELADGRSILSQEQAQAVRGMARRISMHPHARSLRDTAGHTETVIVWDDPSGIKCKARLDKIILLADAATIVDIKTPATTHSGGTLRTSATPCKQRCTNARAAWRVSRSSPSRSSQSRTNRPTASTCFK
jgi:hypothetical protein